MTLFKFDARASLAKARSRRYSPNPPNPPDQGASFRAGNGETGRIGMEPVSVSEMSSRKLALDHYEERAAIREYCDGQSRAEAERSALTEAAEAWGIPAKDILGALHNIPPTQS